MLPTSHPPSPLKPGEGRARGVVEDSLICYTLGFHHLRNIWYVLVFDMEGHWRDQNWMRDAGEENVPSAGLDYVSVTLMKPSVAATTSRLPACMHQHKNVNQY
ncbi:hypothetical protein KC360_g3 [Hortaea werneckii]|nr:hypothetical protein KC344_g3 [Hortaea werneckii]KAI7180378.1 hypothetical protein KC360_g3 [Hortaea werneckii]